MSPTALAAHLHSLPLRMVLAITGGGVAVPRELLTVPGGSATVLDVAVPYSMGALEEWVGGPLGQYCCRGTASAMAMTSWQRARRLAPKDDDTLSIGVGVTAALVSDRPKRGDHRAHIVVQSLGGTSAVDITLAKGQRSRVEEDDLVSRLTLATIAAFVTSDPTPTIDGLLPDDHLTSEAAAFPQAAVAVLDDISPASVWRPDGTLGSVEELSWGGVLSGSFNPLHEGHRSLRDAAADHLGVHVGFELPLANADKPSVDALGLRSRLAAFEEPVLLSRLPLFPQKATTYPGWVLVVGYDTAVRVLHPRYYGGLPQRDAALDAIAAAGCRFLVAARLCEGDCKSRDDLDVGRFGDLFEPLPGFRQDISSTELRALR